MRRSGTTFRAPPASAAHCSKPWNSEMAEHVIKLPDVGEGVAEAEVVEWNVKVGDLVREDAILAAVMTDKATVEIPSPIDGEVLWLGANVGDVVAVGSDLIRLKVASDDKRLASVARPAPATAQPAADAKVERARPAGARPASAISPSAESAPLRRTVRAAP